MLWFLLSLACALVAMGAAALYGAFADVSPKELKRRARDGDEVASLLYRSVSYGLSTKIVLGGLTALAAYISLVCMVRALGAWLAFPVASVLLAVGYFFVRSEGAAHRVSTWLATRTSPALAWLLERLHPVFDRLSRGARRIFPVHLHSGLYEKSDLIELLHRQKTQPDNRINPGEIDLLTHALAFGDKLVSDILVPKRVVTAVATTDAVGPVLMGELHATGHSRFPVYADRQDSVVGVLYLHDLVTAKQSGLVQELMRTKIIYVHEDFTLYQTLQAFIKTKQHLFIVVNSFEEYVGIVTIEDVLEQVIGKTIVDEFDTYDDLRAVAAAAAKKDHDANAKQHAAHTDTTPEK
jgi:CBS domain containing-hemolysin-like protein